VSKLKNVKKVIIGLFTTYTWKATSPADIKGTKLTYTIESIDQGVHNSIDALIVNCTITLIAPNGGSLTKENNSIYLAANNTQNYLNIVKHVWGPVIIPTPINLTLVAEASHAYNYSIDDNTIIINYDGGYTEELTFNTKGFLTEGTIGGGGISEMSFVLATGEAAAVPFGNYFLVFMVIGVIALVYLKKQKIK